MNGERHKCFLRIFIIFFPITEADQDDHLEIDVVLPNGSTIEDYKIFLPNKVGQVGYPLDYLLIFAPDIYFSGFYIKS